MCKRNETQNQYSFAICNPNLNPQSNSTYGWLPTSTQTTLTLNGEWLPLTPVHGVYFNQPVNGQTQVNVTFNNGEPLYFTIRNSNDTNDLSQNKEKDWLTFTNDSAEIHLSFPFGLTEKLTIAIYTADGKIIKKIEREKGIISVNIAINNLSDGSYFCKIANSKQIFFIFLVFFIGYAHHILPNGYYFFTQGHEVQYRVPVADFIVHPSVRAAHHIAQVTVIAL